MGFEICRFFIEKKGKKKILKLNYIFAQTEPAIGMLIESIARDSLIVTQVGFLDRLCSKK